METEAPCYTWRRTSGAAPDAVKAARPVLNGGREETCRKVTRLAPTQHHHTGQVLAYVFGTREDETFGGVSIELIIATRRGESQKIHDTYQLN